MARNLGGEVRISALLAVGLLLAACAPAERAGSTDTMPPERPRQQKRITAAIIGDAQTVYNKLNPGSVIRGIDALEELVHVGLANIDNQGALRPQLADAVPTVENGLWRLLSDGRMEVTWTIRPNARWHDGTPFTADDLAFTARVVRDAELPIFGDRNYRLLAAVDAADPRTVTATWTHPFIDADRLFTRTLALPIPKHLLEQAYLDNKAAFTDLPFWSEEFVGTGPYKIREFARGSHVALDANRDYVHGRPRVDVVEVRFITDLNTLVANVLAGSVDMTLGRALSQEMAVQAREQWKDGRVEFAPTSLYRIWGQFLNPSPPIVADVQFRRALYHAIDRQLLVDTIAGAVTSPAISFLPPNQPQYREVEAGITRYDYDPRQSAQIIESLGYSRGTDGAFRDPANQPLSVELWTFAGGDAQEKMVFVLADDWQRAGVATTPFQIPIQRRADAEFAANRPAFLLKGGPSDVRGLGILHSSQALLPETRYVGSNDGRYMSPAYDSLYERYVTTIPMKERTGILRQMVHHIAEHLPLLPLFYRVDPSMLSHRLVNVGVRTEHANESWNAHEWDVK